MSKEPTLLEQTKKIFNETVDIYRNDLFAMFKRPLPLIIIIVTIILFWLAIGWV